MMRTREQVETDPHPIDRLVLEVLIDIRDLLMPKDKEEPKPQEPIVIKKKRGRPKKVK